MVAITPKHARRARSDHTRRLRRALIERLRPGLGSAPRASTLVLALTAAAMLAGLILSMIAPHLGGAQ
ncbi:hypothetical protein [Microvirga sp. M2]|uniref:hypothetical protein n=1 Tax=Microvirga sp. M2 TaxID=3073270 RepID=UPI0039C01776